MQNTENRERIHRKKHIFSKTPKGKENDRAISRTSQQKIKSPSQKLKVSAKLKNSRANLNTNIITEYAIKEV